MHGVKSLFVVSFEKNTTKRTSSVKLVNIYNTYKILSLLKPTNSFVPRTLNLFFLRYLIPISTKNKLSLIHLRLHVGIAFVFCPESCVIANIAADKLTLFRLGGGGGGDF